MNQGDRSRLEEFRQFRKGIRGSSEDLFVGIDVAKEKHHAFLVRPPGRRFSGDWSLKITWRGFGSFWRKRKR